MSKWIPLDQKLREQQGRDEIVRSLRTLFRGSVPASVAKQVSESVDYDIEAAATLLSEMTANGTALSSCSAAASELATPAEPREKFKRKGKMKGQPVVKQTLQQFWSMTAPCGHCSSISERQCREQTT